MLKKSSLSLIAVLPSTNKAAAIYDHKYKKNNT